MRSSGSFGVILQFCFFLEHWSCNETANGSIALIAASSSIWHCHAFFFLMQVFARNNKAVLQTIVYLRDPENAWRRLMQLGFSAGHSFTGTQLRIGPGGDEKATTATKLPHPVPRWTAVRPSRWGPFFCFVRFRSSPFSDIFNNDSMKLNRSQHRLFRPIWYISVPVTY